MGMERLVTAGLHHIGLVSADAARTAAFYGGVLGLRRLSAAGVGAGANAAPSHGAGPQDPLVFGNAAGEAGTLVSFSVQPEARRGSPGIGGVHHLAFSVATDDALLKWKRRLSDAGVRVTGPYDRGYFTSIYFADPDGQVVEIATDGPGYAVDETPDELGQGMMIPPQRIVRGFRDEAAIAALTHDGPVPEVTDDMVLDGLHHISGITDGLAGAGALLEELLGLRLVKRTTNRDDPSQLHYFWAAWQGGAPAPRSAYTLFGWPPGWRRARPGRGQATHVAFRAADEDELGLWRERLHARGIAAEGIVRNATWSAVRFGAPDGQLFEIAVDHRS
jgi:glyoxalase family protein